MVLDTSALLAILFDEPERRSFNEAIEAAGDRLLSVATLVETSIVLEVRYGAEGVRDLDEFLNTAGMTVVPADADQGQLARQAYRRYGKGRHAAGLNFGDCFSYALARSVNESLLYKGMHFAKTDIPPAI
ncbi:MAG TPA: type II toxin-antitoxin system VapC family toxin [Gammaproteobacteria bacterium]